MNTSHLGCPDFLRLQAQASRRTILRVGAFGGLSLPAFFRLEQARGDQKHYENREGKAKSVIQIFLQGGMAHQESFDPKPEAPLEYRGPFGVIQTKLPGVRFSATIPRMAEIADRMTVIRSLTGKESDHGRGQYAMLTGYRMNPALKHPSMGSVVAHEFGSRNHLPGYIAIPEPFAEYSGPGYLGPRYQAFGIGGDPAKPGFTVRDLKLPAGVDERVFEDRRAAQAIISKQFASLETDRATLDAMDEFYQRAYAMIDAQSVREAFDLSREPDAVKVRYGQGLYISGGGGASTGSVAGLRLLLARRLVEAGARFIQVNYGGWDSHSDIKRMFDEQMPALDHAVNALILDLEERGLLDSTLVMVSTEFGRTPKINRGAGRDHYSRVFSFAMAGGGIRRGYVHGASDATASEPADAAMTIEDLHTTIYHQLGINADKELMAPGARPIEIIDGGRVVKEMIA